MKRYELPVHDDYRAAWTAGVVTASLGLAATATCVAFGSALWIIFALVFVFGALLVWHQWFESDRTLHREGLRRRDREAQHH